MFLRFSKGAYFKTHKSKIRKGVFLGNSVVMEYGNQIVGIAKLYKEDDRCLDFDIVVAKDCELGSEHIVRFIKDMIWKSHAFTDTPTYKRRKYSVEEIACAVLPVKAEISFQRI